MNQSIVSGVSFEIEEQLSDQRSNDKSYTFKVQNSGSSTIEILSIKPRIPDGVQVIEVRDSALAGANARVQELCEQLSNLVSGEILKQLSTEFKKHYGIGVGASGSIVDAFNSVPLSSQRYRDIEFKIENVADGENARKTFLDTTRTNSGSNSNTPEEKSSSYKLDATVLKIYDAKLEQLKSYEPSEPTKDHKKKELAVVAPDSFFAIGYTLKFPRNRFEPEKFTISIDVTYRKLEATIEESKQKLVGSATQSVVISPVPWVLSLVTFLAGWAGVVVSLTTDVTVEDRVLIWQSADNWIGGTFTSAFVELGIGAGLLSIIVFNIYEYLSFGRNLESLGVGWRSAIAIGAICGLFEERILGALNAIIGS